jgi:hypothetical protein
VQAGLALAQVASDPAAGALPRDAHLGRDKSGGGSECVIEADDPPIAAGGAVLGDLLTAGKSLAPFTVNLTNGATADCLIVTVRISRFQIGSFGWSVAAVPLVP